MDATSGQLVVRQHERFRCSLKAALTIAPEHADRIVLSSTAAGLGSSGEVKAEVIDLSLGGIGIKSPVFLPKMCRLSVRVEYADGEIFEAPVRLQRVTMIDRKPAYYLGASFLEDGPPHVKKVTQLISSSNATAVVAGAGGGKC